jgi:DNA-binding NtrC family response regulator
VKVRVIAATDSDLEAAVARGTFSSALLNRFDAGYLIYLPPLAQRREDTGALFLHFLRDLLASTGELDRLEPRAAKERPWLYARDFGRIALAPFAGSNLRRLLAIARRVVISSRGQPFADLDAKFDKLVSVAELPAESETPRRPGQPTNRQLKDALDRNGYNLSAAARELLINRGTLYARARSAGLIRNAEDVADDVVLEAYERHQGVIARTATELRVSQQALQKHLRDLLRRKR